MFSFFLSRFINWKYMYTNQDNKYNIKHFNTNATSFNFTDQLLLI